MKKIDINPKKFSDLKYEAKVNISPIFAYRCGCTIIEPHSHLVAGFTCECEKGQPNLVK